MGERCLCESSGIAMFSCSGASNVGQIANKVAVDLSKAGEGRFFCIAGIGGHVSGITESTKAAEKIVVIDGCKVGCGKKTLEHAGFEVDVHTMVTDNGVEKSHEIEVAEEDCARVADKVREALKG